jgi:hypothetical protein
LPAAPLRIGPLQSLASTSPYAGLCVLIFLLFILSAVVVPVVLIGSGGAATLYWIPGGAALGLMAVAFLMLLLLSVRGSKDQRWRYVTVDASGLEWAGLGPRSKQRQPRRIAWSEVRSLSRMSNAQYTSSASSLTPFGLTLYLLDAPDAQLIWAASTIGLSYREEAAAASEMLLRVAVTRTGKPLRDLSAVAAEVLRPDGTAMRLLPTVPATNDAPLAGVYPPPKGRAGRRPSLVVAMSLVLSLLLTTGLIAGGVWLQNYLPQYYASLPARVAASTSLFHDDLAELDNNWPLVNATKDGVGGAAYVASTYQLSGLVPGYITSQTEPHEFGDAAYAVTAAETGAIPKNSTDGVGLVLHESRNGNVYLIFYVDRSGGRTFETYHYVDGSGNDEFTPLDSGQSSAIHTAAGDENRLLVIAHGTKYLFYVNGQYLDHYDAVPSDHLPTYGMAGVYLNQTGTTGIFSQFDVYALPQPTWLDPA